MNCINHPATPVSAYCQNCGKALCQECVRSVGGVVYCEQCLAARLNQPGAGTPGGSVYVGLPASGFPNPGLALGLGFIPGVGAMYNGQFIKGLAHVFVFALLCSFSAHESFFGILIPFWIAYQVFDAYQTARARRDGTPLPNPFGLNDLGYRLGLQQHPEGTTVPPASAPYAATAYPPPPAAGAYVPPYTPTGDPSAPGWTSYTQQPGSVYSGSGNPGAVHPGAAGFVAGFAPGPAETGAPQPAYEYTQPYPQPGAPPPYAVNSVRIGRNDLPTGAIVLIALGTLFLLGSLGIFHDDWISRSWPLAIVAIGVWLLVRRARENRVNPPTQPGERTSL